MKEQTKVVLMVAMLLGAGVLLYGQSGNFNLQMYASTSTTTNWKDYYVTKSLPTDTGSSNAQLWRNQFTDAARKELCIATTIKTSKALSQKITIKGTIEAYFRQSNEKGSTWLEYWHLGQKRDAYAGNGLGGYYWQISLNGKVILEIGRGTNGVVIKDPNKIIMVTSPPTADKLPKTDGYKWNGGSYGSIDSWYQDNNHGWHLPLSGKMSCGKNSGAWATYVANKLWMTGNGWKTVNTYPVEFYIKGVQTGNLEIVLLTNFCYRWDGSENWNTWGGNWCSGGSIAAVDNIKLT